MSQSMSRVGKRRTVFIPAALSRRFGIEEGSLIIAEDREEGILIRPAVAVPFEGYSPERGAESLLSNAVDGEDYARVEEGVRKMGLGPAGIPPLQSSKASECLRGRSGLLGR